MNDDEERKAQRVLSEKRSAKREADKEKRRPPLPEREIRTGGASVTAHMAKGQRQRTRVDEATTVYDGAVLTEENARFWLTMDAWTVDEAAYLLCAIDPQTLNAWAALNSGLFAVRFPDAYTSVRPLLQRAAEVGALQFPALPTDVVAWAMKKNLMLPALLIPAGAVFRDGRWFNDRTRSGKNGNDLEEGLRLAKFRHVEHGPAIADDTKDHEADELMRLANEGQEQQRAIRTRRIAEGRCFIDEAAMAIAEQHEKNRSWQQRLCEGMVNAAEQRALTARDHLTFLPIPAGQPVSISFIVTRTDVNAWLETQGVEYRWESDRKADTTPQGAATEKRAESAEARQCRRFDRYRELGGERVLKPGGSWKASGKRGALARLAREEAEAAKQYSDARDVAHDLDIEAQRRRANRAMPQG